MDNIAVLDSENEDQPLNRPREIYISAVVLFVTLIFGLLKPFIDPRFFEPYGGWIALLVVFLLTSLILGFFLYKVAKGRKWARIVLAVITLLGLYSAYVQIVGEMDISLGLAVVSSMQAIGQVFSVLILFKPSVNEWFHSA